MADDATDLQQALHHAAGAAARVADRIGVLETENAALSERLVSLEQQTNRLMNLYVAAYQLHAALDPAEVVVTIGDIATNLLGFERFVLLLKRQQASDCEVALARGVETSELVEGLDESGYVGGDPLVDATLRDGTIGFGPAAGSLALATVPLVAQGTTVGALVLLKLFDHKPKLEPNDREMLDLLAAHAASALFAARSYASADRKLRTLENLFQLVRRS